MSFNPDKKIMSFNKNYNATSQQFWKPIHHMYVISKFVLTTLH